MDLWRIERFCRRPERVAHPPEKEQQIYRTAADAGVKPKHGCTVRATLPALNGGACRAPN